jgi:hypothetical protein
MGSTSISGGVEVKRFVVVVCLAAVAGFVTCPAALAGPPRTARAQGVTAAPTAASAPTYPLRVIGEWYDGAPLDGAGIAWGWLDPDLPVSSPLATLHYGNWLDAGPKGRWSFKAVKAHAGHDEVEADGPFRNHDLEYPTAAEPSLMYIGRWGLDFSTLGSILLRPGRVQVDIANVPAKQFMDVSLGDPATGETDSIIGKGGHGLADCPPPDFTSAVATMNTGGDDDGTAACEWISPGATPWAVNAGSVTPGAVTMDWSKAVRGHILGPRCQRVRRPGGTLRFSLSNVPAGEQFSFCATQWVGSTLPLSPVVTSTSPQATYTVRVRVPRQIEAGQDCYVSAYRSDDPESMLSVQQRFSVCSFSASRAVIRRGEGVRLYGRLDSNGYSATLLAAPAGTPRPATLAAPGWKKVATLKLSNHDAFLSALSPILHPKKSTSYVLRFSDSWFVRVFTPLLTVRVK